MKLTFLGTGGGRVVVINQIRASGGFIIETNNEIIHVDPGPGALVRAKEFKFPLSKVTGILISHGHPDHCTDVEWVIEAITDYTNKKNGFLIAGENVIRGNENYKSAVSSYHLKLLKEYHIITPKESIKINDLKITATPTAHGDPDAVGFVIKGHKTIGYTGDGEYFDGQEKYFKGCDYMVLNVLRPEENKIKFHMTSDEAAKLLKMVKPKLAVIQHFGMYMIKAIPEKEAKHIEEGSGIKTIAARDGMKIDLEKECPELVGLQRWA